jgi:hypothetical protein
LQTPHCRQVISSNPVIRKTALLRERYLPPAKLNAYAGAAKVIAHYLMGKYGQRIYST